MEQSVVLRLGDNSEKQLIGHPTIKTEVGMFKDQHTNYRTRIAMLSASGRQTSST